MALDSDDIKKLDQHIVEPLLEALESLGAQIDGMGTSLGARIDGMGSSLGQRIDGGFSRLLASNEKTHDLFSSWLASERLRLHEVEERLKALEIWKAEVEKKNGKH